ncbi:hypothetical protein JCM3765_004059 [Sporobolomyces pararoseus]
MPIRGNKVAVFWDYENIEVPSDVSVARVVSELTTLAKTYGSLSLVQAYMDTAYGRNGKLQNVRGQLQSNAVTVIDAPHQGRKEVADVMIMTDFLIFALENPGSVIILITADKGFQYPVSVARRKSSKVVLVTTDALKAEGDRGFVADETISYRSELLKMPPKAKNAHSSDQLFRPYAAPQTASTSRQVFQQPRPVSRPFASNSRLLDRLTVSPPAYEDVISPPLRPASLPRMPPSLSPTMASAVEKNARRGNGTGKGKEVAAPRSLGTLVLSDEEDQSENSNLSLSPAPFEYVRNFPSIDSVVASSSNLPNRPASIPPRPSYSSVLQSPSRISSARSRPTKSKPKKRVQVSPSESILIEEAEEEEDPLAMTRPQTNLAARLSPARPAAPSRGKKRGISETINLGDEEDAIPRQTSSERRKKARKEVASMPSGQTNTTEKQESIIVLSDDEDES